jgi:hypothetical protein
MKSGWLHALAYVFEGEGFVLQRAFAWKMAAKWGGANFTQWGNTHITSSFFQK